MLDELLDVLVRQVLSTIEIEAEVLDERDAPMDVQSWLAIHGAPARRLHVGMTRSAALKLSTLATGLTPEIILEDPTLFQDLVAEVANIMAGNLWPALEGATGIGLPNEGALPPTSGARTRRVYMVDGVRALVASLDEVPE